MTQDKDNLAVRTIEPCRHMEQWVNGLADGSLKGLARLVTRFHIATCLKCRTALQALQALRLRLHGLNASAESETLPSLTSERRTALDASLDKIDQQQNTSSRSGRAE